MGLDMRKFTDPKTLTVGVWGLKTSLGQFGPKAFGRGLIKPLFKNQNIGSNFEINPTKSWNLKKFFDLQAWGLETTFGPLVPR